MRVLLILLMVLVPSAVSAAPKSNAKKPETLEQASARFVKQLTGIVEKAGYKNVRIAPQIFVLSAEKKDGSPVGLIVNSETLQAVELTNDLNVQETAQRPSETYLPGLH